MVRLGVIGVGWWSAVNHIPTILSREDAVLAALADPAEDRLRIAGETFGVGALYTDFREMLARESLDGVLVASPHVAHFENATAALAAGAHVLVEKPMTTSAADARALTAAADAAGKQILIPCGWNFGDYTALAARWVADGGIGRIEHVTCVMATALEDLFAGAPMLETKDHLFRPPPSTWADPARAGGYAWGQMSHSLAWVYHVAGLTPAEAFCFAGKSPAGVDYYDAAAVRFVGGATMAASGAATVPKHCGFQLDIRLFGSEGELMFDVERERLELRRRDGRDRVEPMAKGRAAYNGAAPVHRFIDICAGHPVENPSDGLVGQRVVETLDAMYRS
ncbi:MAG: Gfo/Idh/MocA family protein, partial [Alphaproteobacteria bacterium]